MRRIRTSLPLFFICTFNKIQISRFVSFKTNDVYVYTEIQNYKLMQLKISHAFRYRFSTKLFGFLCISLNAKSRWETNIITSLYIVHVQQKSKLVYWCYWYTMEPQHCLLLLGFSLLFYKFTSPTRYFDQGTVYRCILWLEVRQQCTFSSSSRLIALQKTFTVSCCLNAEELSTNLMESVFKLMWTHPYFDSIYFNKPSTEHN